MAIDRSKKYKLTSREICILCEDPNPNTDMLHWDWHKYICSKCAKKLTKFFIDSLTDDIWDEFKGKKAYGRYTSNEYLKEEKKI